MYTYKPLEEKLKALGLNKSDLTHKLNISSRTIAKMAKNEKIADFVLEKLAHYLDCDVKDLYKFIYDNKIIQILTEEKNNKISGGLYHELQVRMTYNSNHIEGSKLTEEQTRHIFETRTIDASEGVSVDDIIETTNHFRCIDYVIDNAIKPLDEDFIKHLHLILKQGTIDSTLDWFMVGDYKKRVNVVGNRKTTRPSDVPKEMKKLLKEYLSKEKIILEDIVEFHAKFELIHPFQDGNGRVGRLIAFKECLYHNITPFIIENSKKLYYYRGLSNWEFDKGFLIGTCLDGQDTFRSILKLLEIE